LVDYIAETLCFSLMSKHPGEYIMPVVRAANAPIFTVDGSHITGLTAPSRGAGELCTWRIEIEPYAKSEAHWLDHEEVFILLDGAITISVAGEDIALQTGDAVSVPARSSLQLINTGRMTAHLVACLPVGAHGTMADGREVGTPPWAQ
jgi:quercetin dioxygenase-like cupin family protein